MKFIMEKIIRDKSVINLKNNNFQASYKQTCEFSNLIQITHGINGQTYSGQNLNGLEVSGRKPTQTAS